VGDDKIVQNPAQLEAKPLSLSVAAAQVPETDLQQERAKERQSIFADSDLRLGDSRYTYSKTRKSATSEIDRALERLLSPDELALSLGWIQPKFNTPGKAVDYISKFFGQENPVSYLGDNAILPPSLELRYFINPKAQHPSLVFANFAEANVRFDGRVKFLSVPFEYRMTNETYRLGLGYQVYAFPKDSDFNVALRTRLDTYYGHIAVKGVSPVWTERFHDRGMGYGIGLGVSVEQKLDTAGLTFLPKDMWIFFQAEYTNGCVADYAKINGLSAFIGVRISLPN
jgi:hypothetical protein